MAQKRIPATKAFEIRNLKVVRILNLLASNVYIKYRDTGGKLEYKKKKEIDNLCEIAEEIRTEDVLKMVEHLNICNRQIYREKNKTDPPCDYIEMKVNNFIFKEIREIKCPKCNKKVKYYDIEGPKKIKCPFCGNEGIVT